MYPEEFCIGNLRTLYYNRYYKNSFQDIPKTIYIFLIYNYKRIRKMIFSDIQFFVQSQANTPIPQKIKRKKKKKKQ